MCHFASEENQEGSISSSRSKYFNFTLWRIQRYLFPGMLILFLVVLSLFCGTKKYLATLCSVKLCIIQEKGF